MTPTQREAALRLADWLHASGVVNSEVKETIALLRELLAEPVQEPKPGERWHIRRPGATTCVTVEIIQATEKTLLVRPHRSPPWTEPERLLRADMLLIEKETP